jgi:hypothetical protein
VACDQLSHGLRDELVAFAEPHNVGVVLGQQPHLRARHRERPVAGQDEGVPPVDVDLFQFVTK